MNSFSAASEPHYGAAKNAGSAVAGSRKPCLQIQMDLSAMLDGELEPGSVRRVMVHSDVCPTCRKFLEGIRRQLRAHRALATAGILSHDGAGSEVDCDAEMLEQLMQNRRQLARILYELGRAYVLMGISPSFSREVAQEPVPIPDMHARGQVLLDEVARQSAGEVGVEWVRAKELFGGSELLSPGDNLKKGKHLLSEAVDLRPEFHEARIYLGHAHHVSEERDAARQQFRAVLDSTSDLITRAFALENLGNVDLEEGHPAASIPYFLQLVESGVVAVEPRFFTTYFNLALAFGLLQEFGECGSWLTKLHSEFPHKRRLVGIELRDRAQFARKVKAHPEVEAEFVAAFPEWFPLPITEAC